MSSDALNGTGRATPHDSASTSTRAHPSRRAPRRLTKPNARPSDGRRNRERVAPEELARLRMMRAGHAVGRVLAVLQKFRLPDTVGPVRPDGVRENRRPEHSLVSFAEEWLSGGYGQERLGVRLAGRLRQFIQHHAEALSEVEQQSMLVHGDFNPLNVIMQPVDGTAKVCALIDWEYAHSGSPLLDLGSMLRCGRDQSDQFEAALVAGYAENGGILPPDWQDVSRALDVMNLCGFLQSRRAGEIARRGVRAIVAATLRERRRR